jgi:SAM-dependent methyltransferase
MPFEELKGRQGTMWGTGPYQNITETITDIHERVMQSLRPQPDERFLDLACGTGAVAELAAASGANVTGLDLAPTLIETARQRARERGLEIEYVVGDAEQLPFEDGSFDVVSSTCGIMFTPDHRASARELARVTASGGRIALANWTPDSAMAGVFGVMRPFQPPPPEGAGNPFQWGDEGHARDLLGDSFELEFETHESPLVHESGEGVWELFYGSYGPTKVLADSLDDDRREELHRAFADFHEQHRVDGGIRMPRRYLLILGRRR